jgi:hypothetical protein
MMGHQHIGVNATPRFLRILAKPIQIEAIVLVGKESRLAIVTALDDVEGNARKGDSGTTRHGGK